MDDKVFSWIGDRPAILMDVNASGAARGALRGDIVMVVDVIDMSTSAEAILEQEPLALYGSALDCSRPPVAVNPFGIGLAAAKDAIAGNTEILVVAEPRMDEKKRLANIQELLKGISQGGANVAGIYPNLGAELGRQVDAQGKVVVLASDTGGVAWNAAFVHGSPIVLTGTVARTPGKKGVKPAEVAVDRCIAAWQQKKVNISIIAASGNSQEDILGAQFIFSLLNQRISLL